MMLPLPTTSEIDTTAEQLKDIERRRSAPVPNIAGAAVDAIKVGSGVQQIADANDARAQAQWFQKEYVDKGWEGYEKLWKESGAPAAAAPQIVRQAYNDSPVAAFKYLGELGEKAKAKEGTEAYAASIEKDDPESAAAVRTGAIKPETVFTQRQTSSRADKATAARTAIAEEKRSFDKIQKDLDRAVAWARVNKTSKGVNLSALEQNQKDLDAIVKEIDKLEADGTAILDPGKLTDARTRRRSLENLVRSTVAKIPDGGVAEADTPPPPPAATTFVWRTSKDGKTEYEFNADTKQPTGKSRPK